MLNLQKHVPTNQSLGLDEATYWARVGVLAALAIVLGYAETFIPIFSSIPGFRLGLANTIVLLALFILDAKSAAAIAAIKVLATGFLFGSPLMMMYSISGTTLAFLSMYAGKKAGVTFPVVLSIVGALFHNVGQLLVAHIVLGTSAVLYVWPLLVFAATFTGFVSGVVVRSIIAALRAGGDVWMP
ncbi:MAG: Gx transporter family protein [Eggerthellaceae bacterium]|nr:Gx transporter family protein [Eggerthellaceae bacterium]